MDKFNHIFFFLSFYHKLAQLVPLEPIDINPISLNPEELFKIQCKGKSCYPQLYNETNIFTSDPTEMATLTPELNWNHNRTTISFFNITRVSEACPPPIGIASSQGCNKNFMEDVNGNIPCQDDFDCPENKEWFIENGCCAHEIPKFDIIVSLFKC